LKVKLLLELFHFLFEGFVCQFDFVQGGFVLIFVVFLNISLTGDENQEGVWRESYENRAIIRRSWYKNKSSSVAMDMTSEIYDQFKKATLFDGYLSLPKEKEGKLRTPVYLYSISLFGEKIITGDQNGTIQIWNCRTTQLQSILHGSKGYVTHTKMVTDKLYSSSFNDKRIFIWDVNYGLCTKKIRNNTNDSGALLKFDIYDKKLYGFSTVNAEIIDIETDKHLLSIQYPHTQGFQVRGCSLFENLLVTSGYGDGLIQVYDIRVKFCVKKN